MNEKRHKPRWVKTLRLLMNKASLNPRSLSLKAGLGVTAVRDMLEGRARYPRYDTVCALAKVLKVSPSELMGGPNEEQPPTASYPPAAASMVDDDSDLDLLVEIISRLQKNLQAQKREVEPEDFAAMTASLYRRMKPPPSATPQGDELDGHVDHIVTYEFLRRRKPR